MQTPCVSTNKYKYKLHSAKGGWEALDTDMELKRCEWVSGEMHSADKDATKNYCIIFENIVRNCGSHCRSSL